MPTKKQCHDATRIQKTNVDAPPQENRKATGIGNHQPTHLIVSENRQDCKSQRLWLQMSSRNVKSTIELNNNVKTNFGNTTSTSKWLTFLNKELFKTTKGHPPKWKFKNKHGRTPVNHTVNDPMTNSRQHIWNKWKPMFAKQHIRINTISAGAESSPSHKIRLPTNVKNHVFNTHFFINLNTKKEPIRLLAHKRATPSNNGWLLKIQSPETREITHTKHHQSISSEQTAIPNHQQNKINDRKADIPWSTEFCNQMSGSTCIETTNDVKFNNNMNIKNVKRKMWTRTTDRAGTLRQISFFFKCILLCPQPTSTSQHRSTFHPIGFFIFGVHATSRRLPCKHLHSMIKELMDLKELMFALLKELSASIVRIPTPTNANLQEQHNDYENEDTVRRDMIFGWNLTNCATTTD